MFKSKNNIQNIETKNINLLVTSKLQTIIFSENKFEKLLNIYF